jgi:prepilin peptidase CpaA
MAADVSTLEPQTSLTAPTVTTPADDSLGIDRAFAIQMARMPLFAVLWVLAAILAHQVWAAVAPTGLNAGPLVVICFGMILAAVIDGVAYKVPNWVTLPLILSGWMLGACHSLGLAVDAGTGGLGWAILCTFLGYALLLPILFIGGVGAGDVKMQMGFGAWVGAFFGTGATTAAAGYEFALGGMRVVCWSFAFGVIAGGVCGLVMMLIRRKWGANAHMYREIGKDLMLIATGNVGAATKRANDRRSIWDKLPYGIPLCIGFLGFLWYVLILRT